MPVDYIKLGERIKLLRTQRNLSQEKLAELINISRVFMGNIERGERVPSLETITDLAVALDVTTDVLLDNHTCSSELDSILWDCTTEEKNILKQNMKDLKATLRHHHITK